MKRFDEEFITLIAMCITVINLLITIINILLILR